MDWCEVIGRFQPALRWQVVKCFNDETFAVQIGTNDLTMMTMNQYGSA